MPVYWLLAYFESLGCLYPVLFSLLHSLPPVEQVEALTGRLQTLLCALGSVTRERRTDNHTWDLYARFLCPVGEVLAVLTREYDYFAFEISLLDLQPICNAGQHELLMFTWGLGEAHFDWEIGHCAVMRASEHGRRVADLYDQQNEATGVQIGQLWHLLECLLGEETLRQRLTL